METNKKFEEKPLLPYQDFSQALRDMKKDGTLPRQFKGLLELRESMPAEELKGMDTWINRIMQRRNEPESTK